MRGSRIVVVSAMVACLVASHVRAPLRDARAEEPAAKPAAAKTVWDGYVWKDNEGRLRIGWGVVAMGVMAEQPHVIAGPAAERLAKHAIAKGDYVFWNYDLERPDAEALKGLPRLLVRVEGVVEVVGGDPPGTFNMPPGGTLNMKDARVAAVEFVDETWLKAWAVWFREKASPWRIRDDGDRSDAGQRAFAVKGLASLQAMLAVPGPSEAQRAEARALGANGVPETRVWNRFRRSTETDLQRWLVDESKAKGWALPGLEKLPPLPPSGTEIQSWFLGSATKKEFLEGATKAWTSDLGVLELAYYWEHGSSTTSMSLDLEQVRERWSEEDFARFQKTTKAMLGGR
jgi:hypothetical protein